MSYPMQTGYAVPPSYPGYPPMAPMGGVPSYGAPPVYGQDVYQGSYPPPVAYPTVAPAQSFGVMDAIRSFFASIMGLFHHATPAPVAAPTMAYPQPAPIPMGVAFPPAPPAPIQAPAAVPAAPTPVAPAPAASGLGPVPLEGYDSNKLNDPNHRTVKYVFGRVASHYPLNGVRDKASAEALLNSMLPALRAAGLEVVGAHGDCLQVKTDVGYEWVDVVRGSGSGNPGWWWGSEGKGTPTPTSR